MSRFRSVVLYLYVIFLLSLISHASKTLDKPDFVISNEYDQNIKVRLTFEYKRDCPFIAEQENILIPPRQKHPVSLNQLHLIDSESKSRVDISELNLECMIIAVDQPKLVSNDETEPNFKPKPDPSPEDGGDLEEDIDPDFQPGAAALVFLGRVTHLQILEISPDRLGIVGRKEEIKT